MINDDAPAVDDALVALREILPRVIKGFRNRRAAVMPVDLQHIFERGALGPRHLLALSHLAGAEPMSVGELGERLNVSFPTVSIVVHELADAGLARRSDDPADRRRTIVTLDPAHRERVDECLRLAFEPLRRTLERLPAADRAVFVHALHILADELYSDPEPAREERNTE